jgi:hypothetical protein
MSILFLGNKYTGYQLGTKKINNLYMYCLDCGWIDEDVYINDADGIFAELGLHTRFHDKHEDPWILCRDDEIEIMRYQLGHWKHFVVGDGHGHVAYDPMGVSRAVKEGELRDKRIFDLVGRSRL